MCVMPGMDKLVADFTAWAAVMLLDALQRRGWFCSAGETRSVEELRADCIPAYARFLPEALSILQETGMLPTCVPVQTDGCAQVP